MRQGKTDRFPPEKAELVKCVKIINQVDTARTTNRVTVMLLFTFRKWSKSPPLFQWLVFNEDFKQTSFELCYVLFVVDGVLKYFSSVYTTLNLKPFNKFEKKPALLQIRYLLKDELTNVSYVWTFSLTGLISIWPWWSWVIGSCWSQLLCEYLTVMASEFSDYWAIDHSESCNLKWTLYKMIAHNCSIISYVLLISVRRNKLIILSGTAFERRTSNEAKKNIF